LFLAISFLSFSNFTHFISTVGYSIPWRISEQ
jgi:hypothetical protein